MIQINDSYLSDVLYCWTTNEYTKVNQHRHHNQIIFEKQQQQPQRSNKKSSKILKALKKISNKNKTCNNNIIDTCKWPNCNNSCPSARHPLTGLKINPIELFDFYTQISRMDFGNENENNLINGDISSINYHDLMKSMIS